MAEERLQKILARMGIASRRKAEDLILQGRVQVNGKTVVELGTKADPDNDDIRVLGQHVHAPKQSVYLLLHKPKGCVTTTHDPEGRRTVMEFVKGLRIRVFPVGRLDYNSEGALLMTNDGDFANAILSAKSHVEKIYHVKVNGYLTQEQEEEFRTGVPLHGKRTAPAGLHMIRRGSNPWYEVRLVEGRSNQIRIMFRYFDRLVEKLRRTQIGFLKLGPLKPGEVRPLSQHEVDRFRKLLHLGEK
ncbi:MAG: pseudouridine synthase [Bryobacteraceae bacterium]